MMVQKVVVKKVFESFILGKCGCPCKGDIKIRNTHSVLGRFIQFHHSKGKNNGRYKTGTRVTYYGYEEILKGDYPHTRRKDRYLNKHVFLYQEYHQLCMLPWGEVHHRDGNKLNNEISNLEGMMGSRHRYITNKKDRSGTICKTCKSDKTSKVKVKFGYSDHWYGNKIDGFECNNCYRVRKKREKDNK